MHSQKRRSKRSERLDDVMVFQILFNLNIGRFPDPKPAKLTPDGRIGLNTINAIKSFETTIMKLASSDGMLAPGDATVEALLRGLPAGPSEEKLSVVMPRVASQDQSVLRSPGCRDEET